MLITGVVLAIVAPIIGTIIATYVYGGLTGGGIDIAVAGLMKSGQSIFVAAFIPRLIANFVDKVLAVFVVWGIILALPKNLKGSRPGPRPAAPSAESCLTKRQ